MTDYLTEEEQIELLKNWLKQYGLIILVGILIAMVFVSGWQFWQKHQAKIQTHASIIYDDMLTLRAQNKLDTARIKAEKLRTRYAKTVYASMSAFMLARDAVEQKNYQRALSELKWVIDYGRIPALKQIARLRSARILITLKQPQASIQLLNHVDDKTFLGLIDEVIGDAHLSLKNESKARESYQKALTELPNAQIIRPLLQMKYDNLTISKTA